MHQVSRSPRGYCRVDRGKYSVWSWPFIRLASAIGAASGTQPATVSTEQLNEVSEVCGGLVGLSRTNAGMWREAASRGRDGRWGRLCINHLSHGQPHSSNNWFDGKERCELWAGIWAGKDLKTTLLEREPIEENCCTDGICGIKALAEATTCCGTKSTSLCWGLLSTIHLRPPSVFLFFLILTPPPAHAIDGYGAGRGGQ